MLSEDSVKKTTVGYMPLLNVPADDYNMSNILFRRCMYVDFLLQNPYTIIGVDQTLFCRAMQLNPLPAKLFNLIFHPLEVVSR